jgi:hypothetical protein
MTEITSPNEQPSRTQTLLLGSILGAVFGLLAAYFYARANEEEARSSGRVKRASAGEVIGLGLAALGMVRQIAEMGRSPGKKR